MKNLILRLLLFIAVYIAAGHIIKSFAPYHWGNPWWNDKMRILDRADSKPTVYFIGSSRTYRQVIPSVFDSVMALNGSISRSFNLGSIETFTPQTYFLLEHAVASGDLAKGSTIFLDFMAVPRLDPKRTSLARYIYWLDHKELYFITKSYVHCRGDRKLTNFQGPYLFAYVKNALHISQFKGFVGQNDPQYEELDHLNSAGFLSLTKEYEHYPDRAEDLSSRQEEIRLDTSLIGSRRALANEVRARNRGSACQIHLERLKTLDELCAEHDIELIHLLPAPFVLEDDEWATFQELPKDARIDMGYPGAFPEFYQLENIFDRGHLNEKGAIIYTTYLAREYARLRTNRTE